MENILQSLNNLLNSQFRLSKNLQAFLLDQLGVDNYVAAYGYAPHF